MREIKFRGKRVDNGEWVYGVPYTKEIFSTEHKKIIGYKTYIITYLADDLRSIERDEVDPNTVGQFTGLHDKNGVEIYEGDIVLSDFFTWEGKCIVKFGEYDNEEQWDNARMGYGYYTEMLNGEPSSRRELGNDVIEVISNIHEEVVE